MRVARYVAPRTLELTTIDDPSPAPGQAVVEVAACGICGSDLHSYGSGYAARPGQVLGHELSGRVLSAPGVDGLDPQTRVVVRPLIPCRHCRRCVAGEPELCERGYPEQIGYGANGAFAERLLVPRAAVGETIFVLPDAVSDEAGALVEPLAVALHAVSLAAIRPGELVVVFGLGTIGLGAVSFARLVGAGTVVAFDPSPLRRERAAELGADVVADPSGRRPVEVVRELTGRGQFGGARADVVLECAGAPAAFADGVASLRNGGRLIAAALYGRGFELDPSRIVEKALTVRGSLGYRDEFATVIDLLAGGKVDPDRLISHRFALEDVDAAFRAQQRRDDSLKVLVLPR